MNISNDKLSDAVKALIMKDIFFSSVLLQQNFVEDNSANNPTCAVDGESFFFNSSFCNSLSFDELLGVTAHEAFHLIGGHHWRAGERNMSIWNKAADYALNAELIKKGYTLPKGCLLDSRFNGESAENIYRTLFAEDQQKKEEKRKQDEQKKKDDKGQDSKDSNGNSSNPSNDQGQDEANGNGSESAEGQGEGSNNQGAGDESGSEGSNEPGQFGQIRKAPNKTDKQSEAENIIQVAKALSIAKAAAGNISAATQLEINRAKQGVTDWRAILHRFFSEFTQSDFSYSRPHAAYMGRGIAFPTLRARNTGTVILICDTSGSTLGEMGKMVAEISACMEQYMNDGTAKPLTVIYADSEVCGTQTIEPGSDGSEIKPLGGGGTKFSPAFEYIENELGGLGEASAVIYLTDGESSDFPSFSPDYPVLWGLVRDNAKFKPPFGEIVNVME